MWYACRQTSFNYLFWTAAYCMVLSGTAHDHIGRLAARSPSGKYCTLKLRDLLRKLS